jgi:hypothetical protein
MRNPLFALAGYTRLVEYIENQFNYTRGTDLFALPYGEYRRCWLLFSSRLVRSLQEFQFMTL